MTNQIIAELVGIKKRLRTLEMAPRLAAASLEDASIPSFDRDGNLKAVIGQQPDGAHTVVVVDGPTPLQPTDPIAQGGSYLAEVTWDGNLIGPFGTVDAELDIYSDFEACEVFAGATEGFIPEGRPLAEIGRLGGTVSVPLPLGTRWIRLRIRSQAKKVGPPSPAVPVEVVPLVDPATAAVALAEFITVKANNILAGEIDVVLRISTQGSIEVGPTTQPHVYIGQGAIEARVPGQSGPRTTVSLGGTTGNLFNVLDADGAVLGGIKDDGAMVTPMIDAGEVRIAGEDILSIVNPYAQGAKVWLPEQIGSVGPYYERTGVWEFDLNAIGGRRYKIEVVADYSTGSGVEHLYAGMIKTTTTDGTRPPAPSVSMSRYGAVKVADTPTGGGFRTHVFSWWYTPAVDERSRFLWYIEPYSGEVSTRNFSIQVSDQGINPRNQGRASLGGATGAPPPVEQEPEQDYVKDWYFATHQVWTQYGKGDTYAPQWVRHGTASGISSIYRTYLPLPSGALSAIASASSVANIWVRLAQHGGYEGEPYTGLTDTTSVSGSTEPSLDILGRASGQVYKAGRNLWFRLGPGQRDAIANGSRKGIVIGRTTAVTLQDFYGTGASSTVRPKLRIAYTA